MYIRAKKLLKVVIALCLVFVLSAVAYAAEASPTALDHCPGGRIVTVVQDRVLNTYYVPHGDHNDLHTYWCTLTQTKCSVCGAILSNVYNPYEFFMGDCPKLSRIIHN